jgi:hypothetical protein
VPPFSDLGPDDSFDLDFAKFDARSPLPPEYIAGKIRIRMDAFTCPECFMPNFRETPLKLFRIITSAVLKIPLKGLSNKRKQVVKVVSNDLL